MDFELTEDTRKYLYQEFSKLDRNGSGNMNVHDLGKCLNSLGFSVVEGELEYLQKNFDRDGDGCLSVQELVDNMGVIHAHCLKRDELMEAFSVFDINKAGHIRLPHMLKILTLNDFMPVQEARQFLDYLARTYDKNHDGKFDYGEFVQMFMSEDIFEKFTKGNHGKKDATKETSTGSHQ